MPRSTPRTRLSVTALEDRTTPAATAAVATAYAVGVADGQAGSVVLYNADGSQQFSVSPYGPTFTGGVRVATADVTGDGVADLITAPGAGTAPVVKVYDGGASAAAGSPQLAASFDAYDATFLGGVYVAAADLTGDGKAEIVTGADLGGGPRVRVFDGATAGTGTAPTTLDDFMAIDDPNFRGGVRIALGDINGDGTADLVVGAGYGGGPRVTVYDGAALAAGTQTKLVADFFAFEDVLRNGVYVGVGDLNGDGCGDLIFGAGPGGGPRVMALDGKGMLAGRPDPLANFFAGDPGSRQGVQVSGLVGADGSVSISTLDRASGANGTFGRDGRPHDGPGGPGGGHGPVGTPPPDGGPGGHGTPIAVTTDTATAVQGTFTGGGSGTLTTFTAPGTAPTTAAATATVSLQLTGATLDAPRPGSTDTTSYGLTLTGTLTVTLDGGPATTLTVTGHFRLTAAGTLEGQLHVGSTDSAGSTQSVVLDGSLSGDTLTVDRLALVERTGTSAGTVFRSPATRDATPIALTRV